MKQWSVLWKRERVLRTEVKLIRQAFGKLTRAYIQSVSWRFRGSVLNGVIQVQIKVGPPNSMAKPWTVVLNLILTHLRNFHQLAGHAKHDSSGKEGWSPPQRAASRLALGKLWFTNLPHWKALSRLLVPSRFRSSVHNTEDITTCWRWWDRQVLWEWSPT